MSRGSKSRAAYKARLHVLRGHAERERYVAEVMGRYEALRQTAPREASAGYGRHADTLQMENGNDMLKFFFPIDAKS
jgi:hypothetical protein